MIKYYCDNPDCGVEINDNFEKKITVEDELVDLKVEFILCHDCKATFDTLNKQEIIKRLMG